MFESSNDEQLFVLPKLHLKQLGSLAHNAMSEINTE